MMNRSMIKFLPLLLIALLVACGNPDSLNIASTDEVALPDFVTTTVENITEHENTPPQVDVPTYDNTLEELDDERPQPEIFEIVPSIAAPGGVVKIMIQEAIIGNIILKHKGEMVISYPVSEPVSEIILPTNIPDGLYFVEMSIDGALAGYSSFRVASEPGVWLETNRIYRDAGNPTIFRVKNYQLPEDTIGAVYLTDSAGEMTPYVPDEHGYLAPGLPVALTQFTGRELYLMESGSAAFQFKAGLAPQVHPEERDKVVEWNSNTVTLSDCDQPSLIKGTLPGGGYVSVTWLNGQIFSRTTYTDNGSYAIQAGPGIAILQTMTETPSGYELNQQSIGATCGEEIQYAVDDNQPPTRIPLQKGRKITLLDRVDPLMSLLISPEAQENQDQICRRGLIDPVVTINGKPDVERARVAGLALKSAISSTSPHSSIVTTSDISDLINAAALEALENEGLVNLENVSAALSTDFLIRLTASTIGDSMPVLVRAIPFQPFDQQVFHSGSSSVEQLGVNTLPVYQAFSESFSHAAVCGEVTPERTTVSLGEEVSLKYKVYDLSGESADGAHVTISDPACGTLNPEDGQIQNGEFETIYRFPEDQFCDEALDFSAEWENPVGSLMTRENEAVAVITPQKASIAISVGYVPGIGNQNANIVEAATVYQNWDEARSPGDLPPISQVGECKFLEGGIELQDQFWYESSTNPGKRAESVFSLRSYGDLTHPLNRFSDTPADHFLLRMQTYAYAVPVEDDTPAREASAYAGNGSIISMGYPSTVFVIDISNPGELPITPIASWRSQIYNEDADYAGFIFYKQIPCGADAGLGSFEAFLGVGIQELYYFSADEGGETSGIVTLPETREKRIQYLFYITNYSVATSIRDDADGIYHGSMAKLMTEVDFYLSQEINSSP